MVQKKVPKKKPPNKKNVKVKVPAKPRVTAVVACDGMQQDVASGKFILIGVFDRILIKNPIEPFRRFVVFTKTHGGIGKHKVGIAMKLPESSWVHLEETELTVGELGFTQGTLAVQNLKVDKEGICEFSVTWDGKRIGTPCSVVIEHIKEEEE